MNTTKPRTSKAIFRQQMRMRFRVIVYLLAACWILTSLVIFIGAPGHGPFERNKNSFSYLTSMKDQNWVRVYTGSDFTASLLKTEIENAGIEVQLKSDKEAGLHAGFGSSGFAQIWVDSEKLEQAKEVVADFEQRMK